MLLVARTRPSLFAALLLLLMNALALAQHPSHTPAFVSVGLGPFWPEQPGFAETYGSQTVLAGSVGFGLPVVPHLHLYGKVMYIARKSVDETAQFQQWLVDAGLQYGLPLVGDIDLGFQGGVAYSVVSEQMKELDGSSSSVRGSGIQGFFAGLGAERPLERSSCSVFAELQYNAPLSDAAALMSDYGGLSVTVGIRYRFVDDKRSRETAESPASTWKD